MLARILFFAMFLVTLRLVPTLEDALVSSTDMNDAGVALDGDATFKMPRYGFGTCCRKSAKGPLLIKSTKEYLSQGGRLIDTAMMYKNHKDLAIAIRESGIPRNQIWITSKVNTKKASTRQATLNAVKTSAAELGVSYVDLMLIHGMWTLSAEEVVDVWRGLIDAKAAGFAKHIGVSNLDVPTIRSLEQATSIRPAVLQLEFHPWVRPEVHDLVMWCQKQGIAVTAYGSLGGSGNHAQGDAVAKIASAHGVSPAQVLLRWALDRGASVIPGATGAAHIKENLHVPALALSDTELKQIGAPESRPVKFRSWNNLPDEVRKSPPKGKTKKKRRET